MVKDMPRLTVRGEVSTIALAQSTSLRTVPIIPLIVTAYIRHVSVDQICHVSVD